MSALLQSARRTLTTNASGRFILAALVVSLLIWLTYARALTLGFTGWDTLALIEWSRDNLARSPLLLFTKPLLPGLPYYRPLSNFSYALDFALWGVVPVGYQVVDIMIHLMTCLGLLVLGYQVTRRILVGWLAAMLLALHPLFGTLIANISFRQDTLVTLGIVWTLIFTNSFLHAGGARGWLLRVLAWIAFTLAVGVVVTLPLVLALIVVQRRQGRGALREVVTESAPYVMIAAVYLGLHIAVTPRNSLPPVAWSLSQVGLPLVYLRGILAPTLTDRLAATVVVAVFVVAAAWLLWQLVFQRASASPARGVWVLIGLRQSRSRFCCTPLQASSSWKTAMRTSSLRRWCC